MTWHRLIRVAVAATALVLGSVASVQAEVIEEIVAKVNDEIITKSELEAEEQALLAELYRRFAGEELDRQVRVARSRVLQNLIDRKILLQRAERLYDMEKMKQVLVDSFMEQQGIRDKKELEQLLAQEGMTLEDLQRQLVEAAAPEEVLRFEVRDRVAVPEAEVRGYYETHVEEFTEPARVMVSEIVLLVSEQAPREVRRADAARVRERLLAGEDFGAVARELSQAPSASAGGRVGPFGHGEMLPELERVAFALPVGEISEPIETEHGFHIIRVESRTEARVRTFEEVREPIHERLWQRRFQEALSEFLAKARAEATIEVKEQYRQRYALAP